MLFLPGWRWCRECGFLITPSASPGHGRESQLDRWKVLRTLASGPYIVKHEKLCFKSANCPFNWRYFVTRVDGWRQFSAHFFYSRPQTDFSVGSICPLMCVWFASQDHVPIQRFLLSVQAASSKAIPFNLFWIKFCFQWLTSNNDYGEG